MPLDTILLLDTSGSMAGSGIRELKRACSIFLDGVEETARQTGLKVFIIQSLEFGMLSLLLSSMFDCLCDVTMQAGNRQHTCTVS